MTKYLKPGPFSGPTSNGRMTDEEYFVRVGALVYCPACEKNVSLTHQCPKKVEKK